MSEKQHRHYLLALLITILLLVQSFAIWHGVEHPFHLEAIQGEEAQCEVFEAFSHTASAYLVAAAAIELTQRFSATLVLPSITLLLLRQRDTNTIRAPPLS